MRFLFLLLSLFSLPDLNSAANCTDVYCCFTETILEDTLSNGDSAYETALTDRQYYRVLGVHHDCHVFYGWMQFIYQNNKNIHKRLNNSNYDCYSRKIVYIRTQGVSRQMILLVDSVGRRIRLQNVMSFKSQAKGNKERPAIIWLKVNPRDRSEMIYTGPLPAGYDFVTSFNAKYRVFIVARSVSKIRIYELRVIIDKDNTPHAYLRDHFYDLNPILFPPLDDFAVRVTYIDEHATRISGITIVPSTYMYTHWLNRTTAIPFISMVTNSLRDVVLDHSGRQYTYQSKFRHFGSMVNEQCDNMFSYMFYHTEVDNNDPVHDAYWSGIQMTTRRSLNPRNAHRRMAYPHVVLRKNSLKQRKGWVEQIGVFFGFIVGISLLAILMRCMTELVKKELKKRNTTSSTLTH